MSEQATEVVEMTPTTDQQTAADDSNAEKGDKLNPAFQEDEGPEELPPLTYIDFIPQCLGSTMEEKEPNFAEFGTVIEQANQWLLSMPQFSVYKCETITVKLGADFKMDNDCTTMHFSSNGKNVYVRILRVWLIPKADTTIPVQQLAYITVLPDHSGGDLNGFLESLSSTATNRTFNDVQLPAFDNLTLTVDKLNKHLQVKPLSGRILTVETLMFKCQESNTTDKLNTDASIWTENGSNSKVYINGFRLYYIVGQPAHETIGIYNEEPDMIQNKEGLGLRVKFCSFDQTVNKAAHWLQKQQGLRVVNIQTVTIKLERKSGTGPWTLDPAVSGYTEQPSLVESRFTKVLRIAYVREQKLDNPSPYASITLTSRIFIPRRIEGKVFESFSKTILRVIKWLNTTRVPLFACETVKYHMSAEAAGQGFNEERTDHLINTYHGQHYITCVRLYFPTVFQEPPPEIPEAETAGWGCVVS